MNKLILSVLVSMLSLLPVLVSAQVADGSSCENAIQVTDGYELRVTEPCTLWFTAWTYDLPISINYLPDDPAAPSPTGVGDFSCTSGIYDDPNLIALVRDVDKWGYSMPLEFDFSLIRSTGQGGNEYQMDIQSDYRTNMSNYGITYDVQAWVQVTFPGAGTLKLAHDSVFRLCRENSHWLSLPDTLAITPSTATEETFAMPLVEWMNDSVRFIWTGSESLGIWMGNQCDFTCNPADPALLYSIEIPQSPGPDTLDMSSELMREFFNMIGQGGVYYMRFVSAGNGELTVDYMPAQVPDNNAILLRKGESVSLQGGNVSPLYCFPKSWLDDQSWEWMCKPASANMKMYVHPDGQFTTTSSAMTAAHEYTFLPSSPTTKSVCWSRQDGWELQEEASDMYMYVRFFPTEDATVTPCDWSSDKGCQTKSILMLPYDSLQIRKDNSTQIYRLPLQQWKERGQDVEIKWNSYNPLTIYIADTCKFNMSASNAHVIYYTTFTENTTTVLSASTIASWTRSDADGYVYARCLVQATDGVLVTRPINQQPDPVFPPLPDIMPEEDQPLNVISTMDGDVAKYLHNGKLLIVRNGQIYTIQGQLWKK